MNTADLTRTLATLFNELVDGPPESGAFMLNRGDAGLLRSLDRLSAAAASSAPGGGATIAAHVEHLRYGLSLLNRWAAGENPFTDANWAQSWETVAVDEEEWQRLRAGLRDQTERWVGVLRTPREVDGIALDGMLASIAHLAYHLGAIRQIDRAARGPAAID